MANPFQRPALVAGSVGGAPNAGASLPSSASGAGNSPISFTAARSEISDATSGRITLAMLDLILLGIVVFYIATRSTQGGN